VALRPVRHKPCEAGKPGERGRIGREGAKSSKDEGSFAPLCPKALHFRRGFTTDFTDFTDKQIPALPSKYLLCLSHP
jgi:hypothetical protein